MIHQINNETVLIAVLVALGLLIGCAVNYAIYQWKWFGIKPVSPWQFSARRKFPGTTVSNDSAKSLSQLTAFDFVPVFGWLFRRRDAAALGSGFWFRPMLIELGFAVAVPFFFLWQRDGGLHPTGTPAPFAIGAEIWFWGHLILISLMVIATFIDFDEKTIPDKVTIPGTLIALLFAAFLPRFRLPEPLGPGLWQALTFCSPNDIPAANWHQGTGGLAVALAIITIWCAALLPVIWVGGVPLSKVLSFAWASVIRPPRKTESRIRTRNHRGPRAVTTILFALWIGLIGFITVVWLTGHNTAHWNSLFGSLIGLGVGGGMVWAIRIVAGYAMGQEAMGFGDVTLMAMIGAFLGWQAAVLTFVLAPFGGMLIALAQLIFIRRNEIAFGPYLCGSALLLLLFWSTIWPRASEGFFFIGGGTLAIVLGGALVAMAFMLWFLQLVKQAFGGAEEIEDR